MASSPFQHFFHTATGYKPYGYQSRLAATAEADGGKGTTHCRSQLIEVPTGLGKTAAATLAWLWNRAHLQRPDWPRRLVYCLPMRTLVEQTRDEIKGWVEKLAVAGLFHASKPRVVILMGGEEVDPEARDWDIHPEADIILIGTQDMLLSRALNRGYGMSRARWPMHFALLNNDCLWVMDEVQLMGSGLWTSAQLDWMREHRFRTQFPVKTWWISATLGSTFLKTSDRTVDNMPSPDVLKLDSSEWDLPILKACRKVSEVTIRPAAKKGTKNSAAQPSPLEQIAAHVASNHLPGTLSLVVCNQVATARELLQHLSAKQSTNQSTEIRLLTSRFRPQDRKDTLEAVLDFENSRRRDKQHAGLILVSTQVVEAGFDVSATRLWTQLAPWPSILQRLGRLNRDGKSNETAQAFVFTLPEDKKDPLSALPYEKEDLKTAKTLIDALIKASNNNPRSPIRESLLELANGPLKETFHTALEPKAQFYPRALDVHGLFSTEPDVFGGFTDVSPWVRNADASADVTVFWRDFEEKGNLVNEGDGPGFQSMEGCPVAVHNIRKFLTGGKSAYHWNPKSEKWERIRPEDIRPGMTLLLSAKAGGYDIKVGWTGERGGNLGSVPPPGPFESSDDGDSETECGDWVPLDRHLADVEKEAMEITSKLGLVVNSRQLASAIVRAAALHDIGKSWPAWQQALLKTHPEEASSRAATIWAKSPRSQTPFRPGLRHEVASALAMWHRYYRQGITDDFPALAIYLVSAHHGKARTVLADREKTRVPNVCGIVLPEDGGQLAPLPWSDDWKMDFAAAVSGASGEFNADGTEFHLSAPGWTGLVADLLGGWEKDAAAHRCGAVPENEPAALGPFVLAYLEALLRAADMRASSNHPADTIGVLREEPSEYGKAKLSPAETELVAALVEDGLSIQERFRPEPLYRKTGRGHFESRTIEEIQHAKRGEQAR